MGSQACQALGLLVDNSSQKGKTSLYGLYILSIWSLYSSARKEFLLNLNMAKSSGKKSKSSPGKKIIVNSKAYGRHERAARGSQSKIKLSEALKKHSQRMIGSNKPAKLIQEALMPFRANFKGGLFWQRLVKHFAAQAKENRDYSVLGMSNWDLNKAYPTSRIMSPTMTVKVSAPESVLHISINYYFSKRFLERKKDIYAFQITIILLFPDFVKDEIVVLPTVLPEKRLNDLATYSFIVHIPDGAESYITCLKAEALFPKSPISESGNVDKVMCLMETGLLL